MIGIVFRIRGSNPKHQQSDVLSAVTAQSYNSDESRTATQFGGS